MTDGWPRSRPAAIVVVRRMRSALRSRLGFFDDWRTSGLLTLPADLERLRSDPQGSEFLNGLGLFRQVYGCTVKKSPANSCKVVRTLRYARPSGTACTITGDVQEWCDHDVNTLTRAGRWQNARRWTGLLQDFGCFGSGFIMGQVRGAAGVAVLIACVV